MVCAPIYLIQVLASFPPPCLHNRVSSNHFLGSPGVPHLYSQMVLSCASVPSHHWMLTAPHMPLPWGSLLTCCPESSVWGHPSLSSRRGQMMLSAPYPLTVPELGCPQCRSGENDSVPCSVSHFLTWAGATVPRISKFLRAVHTVSAYNSTGLSPRL